MKEVYILTDSRGRGLCEVLDVQQLSEDLDLRVQVKSSSKLLRLIAKARDIFKSRPNTIYIVIVAGICDLTIIKSYGTIKELQYHHNEDNILRMLREIEGIYRDYAGSINIATIYPASLEQFYEYHNKIQQLSPDQEQQKILQKDIQELNKKIIEKNIETAIETINLSGLFHTSSKKKKEKRRVTKFNSKLLPDGVHPDDTTKTKCHNRVNTVLKAELTKKLLEIHSKEDGQSQSATSQSESEQQEIEQWDHKRHKRQRRY